MDNTKSYKNIFKGSVLVCALLDHDPNRFRSRDQAISFAQTLLTTGHLKSVLGSAVFEDTPHLYRWTDIDCRENRENKKAFLTNCAYIPTKKLIEMVDLDIINKANRKETCKETKVPLRRWGSMQRKQVKDSQLKRSRSIHKIIYSSHENGRTDKIGDRSSDSTENGNNIKETTDYETKLLGELANMEIVHQEAVDKYKLQIKELEDHIENLEETIRESQKPHMLDKSTCFPETQTPPPVPPAPPSIPPPPPPLPPKGAPPPPPLPPRRMSSCCTPTSPTKVAIIPKAKMRPLFWDKVAVDTSMSTLWKEMGDVAFDCEEFESLFGRSENDGTLGRKKSIDCGRSTPSNRVAKLLDDPRSRAVGIRLRSLRWTIPDIKRALYDVDFSNVDLDAVHALRKLYATPEELDIINRHQKERGHVPLDKPEQCLLDLSKMDHFTERVDCLVFRKQFGEQLSSLEKQLDSISKACRTIREDNQLKKVMSFILCLGNYMNGGTHRGQADGFSLRILPKLKDVKSMDSNCTLLQYIIQLHTKSTDEKISEYPLPDPVCLQKASCVSFKEIGANLDKLSKKIKSHKAKADIIYQESQNENLEPFKNLFEQFFISAVGAISRYRHTLARTSREFETLLTFFGVSEPQNDDVDNVDASLIHPDSFFRLWMMFLEDYRKGWKEEQRRIVKEKLAKSEADRKKAWMNKRRNSYAGTVSEESPSFSLKNKFNKLRRQSECAPTSKLKRSQSIATLQQTYERTECAADLEEFMDETYKGLNLQTVRRCRSVTKLDIADKETKPTPSRLSSIPDSSATASIDRKIRRSRSIQNLSLNNRERLPVTDSAFSEDDNTPKTKSPSTPPMRAMDNGQHDFQRALQTRRWSRPTSLTSPTTPTPSKPFKSLEQDRQTQEKEDKNKATLKIYLRANKPNETESSSNTEQSEIIPNRVRTQVRRRRSFCGPANEIVKTSDSTSNQRTRISLSELESMDGVLV